MQERVIMRIFRTDVTIQEQCSAHGQHKAGSRSILKRPRSDQRSDNSTPAFPFFFDGFLINRFSKDVFGKLIEVIIWNCKNFRLLVQSLFNKNTALDLLT